jgi:hypothetical protein
MLDGLGIYSPNFSVKCGTSLVARMSLKVTRNGMVTTEVPFKSTKFGLMILRQSTVTGVSSMTLATTLLGVGKCTDGTTLTAIVVLSHGHVSASEGE